MASPRVSVIVPCLNAADTIGGQLDALARQEWDEPWEVVVADNGSTDGTREVVARWADRLPGLRVIDASARQSAGHAMNRGVEEARGESVTFADADDEVGEGWLAALGTALREHEFVACRQDHAKLNEPWVQASREQRFDTGLPTTYFPPYLPYTGAGALGIRKELHERAGGFDEGLYLEDLDYCLRVQLLGPRLHFVPDAVIHYRFRDSLGGIFRQAYNYGRGMAAVQRKHKPRGTRFPGQRKWLVTGWKPVLLELPNARRKGGRARLAWILGGQLGRYRGSFEHRVLAV
ncbi:MAG TPA: glycosyltransferase [Gaiellaceae bacterium]|jgi:glycosyltransferase involved in cell wall biosynthesis